MKQENDAQLIDDILSGDDAAFNTLVEKYQQSVHALVWRKIGDFHYAEEITQDTFLQAYKKLSTLKNPNLFAGWLYVIANRRCVKWLREQKTCPTVVGDHTRARGRKILLYALCIRAARYKYNRGSPGTRSKTS